MGMEDLIAMSELGPNLGLLTSLSRDNSMVLDIQKREFHPALGDKGEREVVSFYETGLSPTAIKVRSLVSSPSCEILTFVSWTTGHGPSADRRKSLSRKRRLRTGETGKLAKSTSAPSTHRTLRSSRLVDMRPIRGLC